MMPNKSCKSGVGSGRNCAELVRIIVMNWGVGGLAFHRAIHLTL